MNLKSTLVIAATLLSLTVTSPSKADVFPTFDGKADILSLLFAAFNDTSSGDPQPLTVNKTKFTVTFKDEFIGSSPKAKQFDKFKPLLIDLEFKASLLRFKGKAPLKEDVKTWLNFYHQGLNHDDLTFPMAAFKRALRKMKSPVKLSDLDANRFLQRLHQFAAGLNNATIRDLEKLTELENGHIIIKESDVSADGKSQVYSVYIGSHIRRFTLTRA